MTTAIVRTLPGLVNDHHRPSAQIPVHQIVDHDRNDYDVRIDVSQHVDLIAFAKALQADPGAFSEFRVIMRSESTGRQVLAAADLMRLPAVRAAFTISIDPAEAGLGAGCLSERLEEASLEPQRCTHFSGDCNKFATADDDYCEEHLADIAEHGPEHDRGSYQGEG